ncbi:major facilitator superfamily domain-containing protein [Aspergillus stella-maris]|uniref:major facilitator superfamily domain-containing protein n=1 Tax=Aspergillus stella-maris TaxID=1810926 RepID=UPI003CCDAF8D
MAAEPSLREKNDQDQAPAEILEANNATTDSNLTLSDQKVEQRDEENLTPKENTRTAAGPPLSGWRRIVIAIAINTGSFLYGLDNTIVADIQGSVVEQFGEIQKLTWLGSGFPLGSIALLLSIGKAYGLWNIKWLWVLSIAIFQIGSAICGAAPNMNALIIGRVIAGAGGAGMYLGGLNLTAVLTTMEERPIYMAINGTVWGVGTIIGPLVGGGFVQSSATWRWAFYINLPIGAAFAPVYLFIIPGFQPDPSQTWMQKFASMDWLGTLLFTATYATWIIGLTFGGTAWPWDDGRTIAVFVVCGVTLIAFCITQKLCFLTNKDMRVFPGELLKKRTTVLLHILTAACGAAMFVPLYYVPIFFQFRGDGAVDAAIRLLPFVFLLVFFMMVNGAFMPRFGYYMPWYLFSGVMILIGGALMSTVKQDTSTSTIYGYTVLIAVGAGATSQAGYSIAPAKVEGRLVPSAIAFINIAQIGGIVMSLTISGTIFQNVTYNNLLGPLGAAGYGSEEIRSTLSGTLSPIYSSLSAELQQTVNLAIVHTIGQLYYLVVAAGALMIVCSALMKREKIYMTLEAGG